tara:strand:+ start:816 stop:1070 length:255 start_codon:yes stop_codon:yes gene_type:complete
MGMLKNLLLGGIGLKTYQNVYNRPIITPPSGYVIRGIKQKGFGSQWVIKYSKKTSMNITSSFNVNKNTRFMNIGNNKFAVDWPS